MTALLIVFAIIILDMLFGAWLASITPYGEELWS